MNSLPSSPEMRHVCHIQVNVAPPLVLGELNGSERRLVAILGGSLSGVGMTGAILPGGSDIQTVRTDGTIELTARYAVDLGEGGKLMIENSGIRRSTGEVPSPPYFRGTVRFAAPAGPLQWLNDSIFVSTGHREGGTVHLDVFELL